MNITLRPSGGRGEYELAGSQGAIHPADLFGRDLFIETLPGVAIDAHSQCLLKDGKPRIRLTKGQRGHPSALIAAAMMLPAPVRTRAKTHGAAAPRWREFVVQTVRVEVATRPDGTVVVAPRMARLESGDNARMDIDFAERMTRVVRVWSAASKTTSPVALAVSEHARALAARVVATTADGRSVACACGHSEAAHDGDDCAHCGCGRYTPPGTPSELEATQAERDALAGEVARLRGVLRGMLASVAHLTDEDGRRECVGCAATWDDRRGGEEWHEGELCPVVVARALLAKEGG